MARVEFVDENQQNKVRDLMNMPRFFDLRPFATLNDDGQPTLADKCSGGPHLERSDMGFGKYGQVLFCFVVTCHKFTNLQTIDEILNRDRERIRAQLLERRRKRKEAALAKENEQKERNTNGGNDNKIDDENGEVEYIETGNNENVDKTVSKQQEQVNTPSRMCFIVSHVLLFHLCAVVISNEIIPETPTYQKHSPITLSPVEVARARTPKRRQKPSPTRHTNDDLTGLFGLYYYYLCISSAAPPESMSNELIQDDMKKTNAMNITNRRLRLKPNTIISNGKHTTVHSNLPYVSLDEDDEEATTTMSMQGLCFMVSAIYIFYLFYRHDKCYIRFEGISNYGY
jgi:hypothetical protein